jgi:hypothetical protein
MSRYELTHLSVGVVNGPMDSPVMADFAANLGRIDAWSGVPALKLHDEYLVT